MESGSAALSHLELLHAALFAFEGYDYVELRVAFKEDLHPFYPPSIAVVRPRLHGRDLAQRANGEAA